MSAPATGPPTPPPSHGLDPIAEAIGELKADVRGLRAGLDKLETRLETGLAKLETRLWWIIGLLIVALLGIAVRR
jgi:hypothetical protein